jgi:hypothetical protein
MIFKDKIEDYTETEFLTFLTAFTEFPDNLQGRALEVYLDRLVTHFELITEHPDRSDVIFYPKAGQEDTAEGILEEVKQWRALNGKPGFKSK